MTHESVKGSNNTQEWEVAATALVRLGGGGRRVCAALLFVYHYSNTRFSKALPSARDLPYACRSEFRSAIVCTSKRPHTPYFIISNNA